MGPLLLVTSCKSRVKQPPLFGVSYNPPCYPHDLLVIYRGPIKLHLQGMGDPPLYIYDLPLPTQLLA